MNIRFVFPCRVAWRHREFWRRQVVDNVGWLRRVWFRWLFDHVAIKCNMAADEGVLC
jgi:hypothetical protein